jgi:hypothetical protein
VCPFDTGNTFSINSSSNMPSFSGILPYPIYSFQNQSWSELKEVIFTYVGFEIVSNFTLALESLAFEAKLTSLSLLLCRSALQPIRFNTILPQVCNGVYGLLSEWCIYSESVRKMVLRFATNDIFSSYLIVMLYVFLFLKSGIPN